MARASPHFVRRAEDAHKSDRLFNLRSLADNLQVSRTPVREALRLLEQVTADANGGLRVATISVHDIAHLYECRVALEQVSVSEACCHATAEQLNTIDRTVTQAEKAITQETHQLIPYQLLHLDYEFHRLIAKSAGNSWLVSLLDQVLDKMTLLKIRTIRYNPCVLEICNEHRQIYQGIVDRQPHRAI